MDQKKKDKRTPRLALEELQVQSFITELKPELAQTAKGGDDSTSEILSQISVQTLVNSGNSKWPCRFACATVTTTPNSGPTSAP